MNREEGKKLIEQRVEDFEKNAAVLKKKGHGETNIRSNYIDIFFEALGWKMKSHYDVHREFARKECRFAKSDSDKKLYEQKIAMLDKKIDDLVYKLYGLTEEEIKIVEG